MDTCYFRHRAVLLFLTVGMLEPTALTFPTFGIKVVVAVMNQPSQFRAMASQKRTA